MVIPGDLPPRCFNCIYSVSPLPRDRRYVARRECGYRHAGGMYCPDLGRPDWCPLEKEDANE